MNSVLAADAAGPDFAMPLRLRGRYHPPAEGDPGPQAGALPALQGLLAGSALSV